MRRAWSFHLTHDLGFVRLRKQCPFLFQLLDLQSQICWEVTTIRADKEAMEDFFLVAITPIEWRLQCGLNVFRYRTEVYRQGKRSLVQVDIR